MDQSEKQKKPSINYFVCQITFICLAESLDPPPPSDTIKPQPQESKLTVQAGKSWLSTGTYWYVICWNSQIIHLFQLHDPQPFVQIYCL